MPRTLFCLRYLHVTWVADGQVRHQTSTKSPLTFEHFPTWQQRLKVDVEKSVLKVRSQEVTVCFMSASLANHLPITCFLRGPNRWKSPGSILKTGLVTKGNGMEAMDHPLYSYDLPPSYFQLFGPFMKYWMERDLQQTLT
jgi:hypothetical protein